ncbi:MAG: DinB family protein [Gemmatimonadota bacterium]
MELATLRRMLAHTPAVLRNLLFDLPPEFAVGNEGPGTWSPHDVIGHLILGEQTDWIPRVEHLLRHGDEIPFPAFDMAAHLQAGVGQTLEQQLDTFAMLRAESLGRLAEFALTSADLERRGRHPEFGVVTLGQHLSTWAAHDLDHLLQVTRCLGRHFTVAVGPWQEYLRVVRPA